MNVLRLTNFFLWTMSLIFVGCSQFMADTQTITGIVKVASSGSQLEIVGASASNTSGSAAPSTAIDGIVDHNNSWKVWSNNAEYLQLELKEKKTLTGIGVAWYAPWRTSYRFDVLVSADGDQWTQVINQKNSSNFTSYQEEVYTFSSVSGKYVRIVGYGSSGRPETRISEVFIYGQDEIPTPAPSPSMGAIASLSVVSVSASADDGNRPENTVDGAFNTRWSAFGEGQTITFDMGQIVRFTGIDIAFFRGDQRQAQFSLEVSDDNTNWVIIGRQNVSSGMSEDFERFSLNEADGRYLRFVGMGNSSNLWNSLLEVSIYGEAVATRPSPAPGPSPSSPANCANGNCLLAVDFENQGTGDYTVAKMAADFNWVGNFQSGLGQGRVNVMSEGGNKFLRLLFKQQTRGHVQWQADLGGTYEEVYLQYRVRFVDRGNGFDFRQGGKLPGLAGGTAPTGGQDSANGQGYSARFMWRNTNSNPDAYFTQYMYDMDKADGRTGRHVTLGGSPIYATTNHWYEVRSRIVMNTPGKADGIIQAWLDGTQVLNITNARLRADSSQGTDILYFSTFFGGSNTPQYQTAKDEYIDYDDFAVWTP